MLQRVFKVTTLCMDTRSQSFRPLANGLIHDALLQPSPRLNKPLLKKWLFLTFPRYSSYSMWVRWTNLQPSNVKFPQDSVCRKWLKLVHFWRSYSKNKNVSVFLGHSVLLLMMLSTKRAILHHCSVPFKSGVNLTTTLNLCTHYLVNF